MQNRAILLKKGQGKLIVENCRQMRATVAFVEETFRHFNQLCFEGALPEIPTVLSKARTFLGKIEYKLKRGIFGNVVGRYDFRLRISVCFDLPQNELEDVVIHEMIHYYIALNNLRDTSAHGKTFRKLMRRINEEYGRSVTVRHKGGRPAYGPERGDVQHIVCISSFRDGKVGVTVASPSKIREIKRGIPKRFDVVRMEWYASGDHFFDRFPKSRTPAVYKADKEELFSRLAGAEPFDVRSL